jgi:hypothetical protein
VAEDSSSGMVEVGEKTSWQPTQDKAV